MSWLQITRLFSTWPGDFVYHLIALFAIEAITGLAYIYRRALPLPHSHVLQAGLALTGGRVLLILAALIVQLADLPTVAILPLLERAIDITGLGLLIWAFVPLWGQSRRASRVLCIANPIAALVVYGVLALGWYSAAI